MVGGDIDRQALQDSFFRIKEDIVRLNQEIFDLKKEQKALIEENMKLRSEKSDADTIKEIVKQTLSALPEQPTRPTRQQRRIRQKKKLLIKNRILELSRRSDLTLPEVKDIVVEDEGLCSKATFYRYITKLKKQGLISLSIVGENTIISRLVSEIY